MCGIAGITGRNADVGVVQRMIQRMHTRGPDDSGFWQDASGTVALGNCRLAILDLSDAGHMPMSDPEGRCRITYNGELYNFRELRRELEARGHTFRSHTDTEVVLSAYLEWGPNCLDRLVGMFAFAIHDGRDPDGPALFLVRDRLGIKPLYWARTDGGFVFASEIKGMLASGLIERVADMQAAWDYLSLGSIPAPRTIVRGVRSLLPGHAMLCRGTEAKRWRYWEAVPPPGERRGPMREHAAALRDLLEEVVAQHLVADVPVGAFLSGGLDSAGIVALASRATNAPVRTFTVGFGQGPLAREELKYAAEVAAKYGSDHHEVLVSGEDVAKEFNAIIDAMDQPSVDGFNTYYVSRAARQAVTVALSGLGADELFAGYPSFRTFARAGRLLPRGSHLLRTAAALAEPWAPRRLMAGPRFAAAPPAERHLQVREYFLPSEKVRLCRRSAFPRGLESTARTFIPLALDIDDPVTGASSIELRSYLPNTLLRDADAMSMTHSLEIRVPFVDHRVVEFGLDLAGGLKLNGAVGKAILRESLADLLPQGSLSRPKMFFSMPLDEWAAGPLLPRLRDALGSDVAASMYEPSRVSHIEGLAARGNSGRAWTAAILATWMEAHEVAP